MNVSFRDRAGTEQIAPTLTDHTNVSVHTDMKGKIAAPIQMTVLRVSFFLRH